MIMLRFRSDQIRKAAMCLYCCFEYIYFMQPRLFVSKTHLLKKISVHLVCSAA